MSCRKYDQLTGDSQGGERQKDPSTFGTEGKDNDDTLHGYQNMAQKGYVLRITVLGNDRMGTS